MQQYPTCQSVFVNNVYYVSFFFQRTENGCIPCIIKNQKHLSSKTAAVYWCIFSFSLKRTTKLSSLCVSWPQIIVHVCSHCHLLLFMMVWSLVLSQRHASRRLCCSLCAVAV